MFTYFMKRGRETRNYSCSSRATTAENCKRNVMHVQNCCFANLKLFFSRDRCRCRRRCLSSLLLWSQNFVTMVTWRHTSLYQCALSSVEASLCFREAGEKQKRMGGARRHGEREPSLTFSLFPSIPARSLLFLLGACAEINAYTNTPFCPCS